MVISRSAAVYNVQQLDSNAAFGEDGSNVEEDANNQQHQNVHHQDLPPSHDHHRQGQSAHVGEHLTDEDIHEQLDEEPLQLAADTLVSSVHQISVQPHADIPDPHSVTQSPNNQQRQNLTENPLPFAAPVNNQNTHPERFKLFHLKNIILIFLFVGILWIFDFAILNNLPYSDFRVTLEFAFTRFCVMIIPLTWVLNNPEVYQFAVEKIQRFLGVVAPL